MKKYKKRKIVGKFGATATSHGFPIRRLRIKEIAKIRTLRIRKQVLS